MRTLDETLAVIAPVEGWLSDDQATRLYRCAEQTRPGDRIVEIGSFRGRSAIVLASAAPDGVEIIAIDPHAGNDRGPQEIAGYADAAATDHDVFNANLRAAGVAERIRHERAFSHDALDRVEPPITVLYIDGAHRYGPALDDIQRWGDRVDDGGTLLIHDSFCSIGVTGAMLRSLLLGRRFRYVGRSRSLAEYRADLPAGWRARAGNAGRQLLQLPWFLKSVALKVALTLRLGRVLERITGRPAEWPY